MAEPHTNHTRVVLDYVSSRPSILYSFPCFYGYRACCLMVWLCARLYKSRFIVIDLLYAIKVVRDTTLCSSVQVAYLGEPQLDVHMKFIA